MSERDVSSVVMPPPVVYLVCVLVGLGLDYVWPLSFLPRPLQYGVGFLIIVLSFVLFGMVLREFARFKTSLNHRNPTTAIVSTGPFAYSRNPVYVSMTMLVIGIAIAVDSVWILVMLVPAVVVIYFFVIVKEEAYLERRFGDDYRRYKAMVRRWV